MPATGLTALAAVEQSGLLDEFPELRGRPLVLGVYGTVCAADRPLRDRDRVEIYRPLRIDPRCDAAQRAAASPSGWKQRPAALVVVVAAAAWTRCVWLRLL